MKCRYCDTLMESKTDSFTHLFFSKPITIHDVPYVICGSCQHTFYTDSDRVNAILKQSFVKGLSEVSFLNS